MNQLYLIAMVNLVLSMPCMFICICRLNAMDKNVLWRVKVEYALGAGAFFISAFRPLIGEWPGYASLAVSSYTLWALFASRGAWRGDRAPAIASCHADLRHANGNEP